MKSVVITDLESVTFKTCVTIYVVLKNKNTRKLATLIIIIRLSTVQTSYLNCYQITFYSMSLVVVDKFLSGLNSYCYEELYRHDLSFTKLNFQVIITLRVLIFFFFFEKAVMSLRFVFLITVLDGIVQDTSENIVFKKRF